MARIKMLQENEAQGKVKELYDNIQKNMGFVPNIMKIVAPNAELFEPWLQYMQALMFTPSQLPQDMKEKIAAVVSNAKRCDYCVRHHIKFQTTYGVDDTTARAIAKNFRQADIPESEKALLAYAEQSAKDATRLSGDDIESLRNNGYSEGQILEATLVIALFSGLNRLVDSLGVELEPMASE